MNQLEYQPPVFPPGSFFHNQALPQGQYPAQQQQQQHHQEAGQQLLHGVQQQQQLQQLAQAQPQPHHLRQLQQQQQQLLQQQTRSIAPDGHSPGHFTSSPYSQSIPAGTVNAAQHQEAALRQSASPHQPNSPFPGQQQIKYPMAAPPLPHSPINTQQFASLTTTTTSAPSTPQSPASRDIEQSRIKLVLEINLDLIQEICSLQAQGRGGATNLQAQAQLKSQDMDDRLATEEYIQTMRRVQANLSWLAPRGNMPGGSTQKALPGPTHMTPPPQMPQLQPKYDKLKELCSGWSGYDGEVAQQANMAAARAAAGLNMNGTTA